MYCKYCGKAIDNDSVFCPHCGKQQTTKERQTETLNPQQKQESVQEDTPIRNTKKRIAQQVPKNIMYVCTCVLLLGLIVWGGVSFCENKKIADITINEVTEDLAKATRNYNRLYSFHEGLARVKKGDKYGFIDKLGHEIIPCKYDDADDFEYGIARIKIGEKEGLIDIQGKIVVACKFDYIGSFDKDSTASARINGVTGKINVKGEVVIPFEYEECGDFRDGLALVRKDNLYGFIDRKNNLVIPCKYEDTYNGIGFSDGLAGVKYEENWGYIDTTGKIIIPFQQGLLGVPFEDGLSTIYRGGQQLLFDTNGLPYIDDSIPFEMAYIDKEGNLASDWHIGQKNGFRNGYATFKDEHRLEGMIDRRGNIVIPCEFTLIAHGFSDDGLFWVSQGAEKNGFYNIRTGRLTVPCEYDIDGFKFCEGLKAVKKSGKCGFINPSNEVVIPFNYDDADDFSEGFAVVERYGKYGYVDRYGNDTFSFQ